MGKFIECKNNCPIVREQQAQKGFVYVGEGKPSFGSGVAEKALPRFSVSWCECFSDKAHLCYLKKSRENTALISDVLDAGMVV